MIFLIFLFLLYLVSLSSLFHPAYQSYSIAKAKINSNRIDQKILHWEDISDSYLKKDFNLSQFSNELQADELELIYYFNEYKEINFEDYLKFLRISFVLKKIESKYLDDHSISDLALISGFKNVKSLEKEFEKVLKSKINDFIEP